MAVSLPADDARKPQPDADTVCRVETPEVVVAREREAVAQARARDLARANQALQDVTDAIASAHRLDEIVPVVLEIAATTFGVETAGLYEHPDNVVRLLYLRTRDGVLNPSDLLALHTHEAARQFAEGVTVPITYIGSEVNQRRRAIVLDHGEGTSIPEFDDWAVRNGMALELNVPLLVGERAVGALVLYRPGMPAYTESEIALAEALGKQLALAMEMARLAEVAREAAVAREREEATKARAAKLAAANALLKVSAERLGRFDDIGEYLGQVLLTITELLGETSATLWIADHDARLNRLSIVVGNGKLVPIAGSGRPQATAPNPTGRSRPAANRSYGTTAIRPVITSSDSDALTAEQREYFRRLGASGLLRVPMVLHGQHLGDFIVRLSGDRPLVEEDAELIQALGNQAAVALHLTRLAEQANEAAVLRERETAARERAEALARIGQASRASLARLAANPQLEGVLGEILSVAASEFEAAGGGVWLIEGDDARLLLSLEAGAIRPPDSSQHPGVAGVDALLPVKSVAAALHDVSQQRPVTLLAYDDASLAGDERLAPFRPFLAAHGIRTILTIPLVLDKTIRGALSLRFTTPRRLSPVEEELAQTLANQAVLALELQRLADAARDAAVAREQEQALAAQTLALSKANQAQQALVDLLSSSRDPDTLILHALALIAGAFGVTDAGFFGLKDTGVICLRTWYRDGNLLSPAEFLALPDMRDDPVSHRLVESVIVPIGYFRPIRAVQPVAEVLDHRAGTASAIFDAWACAHGLDNELNVPVQARDTRIGSLTLYRPAGRRFNLDDVALAEALGKQLALAIENAKLSRAERDAAVAQAQAAELARANEVLARAADRLVRAADESELLAAFLAEAMAISGAAGGAVLRRIEQSTGFEFAVLQDGETTLRDREALDAEPFAAVVRRVSAADPSGFFARRAAGEATWHAVAEAQHRLPEAFDYHTARGHRSLWDVPFSVGNVTRGYISLAFRHEQPPTPVVAETVQALANQVAVALERTRLGLLARTAAVARERERAALDREAALRAEVEDRRRAETVARGQAEALSATLREVAAESEPERLVAIALRAMSEQLGGLGACLRRYDPRVDGFVLVRSFVAGSDDERDLPPTPQIQPASDPLPRRMVDVGRPVVLNAPLQDVTVAPWHAYYGRLGVGTLLALPVQPPRRESLAVAQPNTVVGMVKLYRPEGTSWSATDIELAEALVGQVALAVELARLTDLVRHGAVAEERARVAREIHDTLAATFTGIRLQLVAATRIAPTAPDAAHAAILNAQYLAQVGLRQARESVAALAADAAEHSDLFGALQRLVASFSGTAMPVRLLTRGQPIPVHPDLGLNLARIAQEAVGNAQRYAAPANGRGVTVTVRVVFGPRWIGMAISDNGCGFDPDPEAPGHGLRNMRSRADRIGADLTIRSQPGRGTRIRLCVPHIWSMQAEAPIL